MNIEPDEFYALYYAANGVVLQGNHSGEPHPDYVSRQAIERLTDAVRIIGVKYGPPAAFNS